MRQSWVVGRALRARRGGQLSLPSQNYRLPFSNVDLTQISSARSSRVNVPESRQNATLVNARGELPGKGV